MSCVCCHHSAFTLESLSNAACGPGGAPPHFPSALGPRRVGNSRSGRVFGTLFMGMNLRPGGPDHLEGWYANGSTYYRLAALSMRRWVSQRCLLYSPGRVRRCGGRQIHLRTPLCELSWRGWPGWQHGADASGNASESRRPQLYADTVCRPTLRHRQTGRRCSGLVQRHARLCSTAHRRTNSCNGGLSQNALRNKRCGESTQRGSARGGTRIGSFTYRPYASLHLAGIR